MFSKRSKESKDDSGGGERRRTSRQTADRKFRSSMPVNITSSMMGMSRTNGSRDNLRASVQNGSSTDNNYRRKDSSSSGERRNRRATNDDAKFRASTMTYTRRSTFDSSSDSLDRTKDRHRTTRHPTVDTKFSFNDSSERSGRSSGRSSKSSPTKSSPRHKQQSQSNNNNKLAIKEYLSTLKLPPGIFSSVLQSYNITDSRLYLLDNSSSMKIRDSHLATNNTNGRRSSRTLDSTKQIECVDNVTRWDELSECILFHAKMASKCWILTKYWLVNDETGQGKHKFSLCWGSTQDIPSELSNIKQSIEDVTLSLKQCPLATKLHSIAKGINKQADNLQARDKRVTLIICSQGLPTDENGQTSSKLRKEFQYELAYLGKLPVKVIVRLTTDDERVMDMFNTMDSRFDGLDVLDDYWGEAMEVYLHNPWLTYGMGLHRLREAGLAPEVMDDLDETVLSLDEMYNLCNILFVGDDEFANLPRPIEGDRYTWSKFMRSLRVLVEKEPLQWNPIKKKLMPWINLEKLDAMHGMEDRRCSMFDDQSMHQAAAQAQADDRRQRKSMPDIAEDPPEERRAYRRQTTSSDPLGSQPSPRQRRQQYCRRPSGLQPTDTSTSKKATTLEEVIKHWSHKPTDDYKHFNPLDQLLVTVPNLFPPTNTMVEDHDYYAKWKTLDTDAFSDVSDDEKKELLKRAVRKAKFFLHPDKLPKDLTVKQSTLFKSIWDTLQEREAATLG